ncbi:MAG: hypothetical protein IT378_12725 [Sandaracinaceae bacterium]|nr:hypothetical protein [Sandaracinaceae bacterium]
MRAAEPGDNACPIDETRAVRSASMPILAILGQALLACGPPPSQYAFQGIAVSDNAVWLAVVEDRDVPGGARFWAVSCPRQGGWIDNSACSWNEIETANHRPAARPPAPTPAGPTRTAAILHASQDHPECTGRITIQSEAPTPQGVPGFWLLVCDGQRFYRWSAERERFVERTPTAP